MNTDFSDYKSEPVGGAGVYRVPIGTKILIFLLLCLFSAFSASVPGFILPVLCMTGGSALLAFTWLLTFSPVFLLSAIPGFLISFFLTGSVISAVPSLIYALCGTVTALFLIRRRGKTAVTAAAAVSIGAGLLVCIILSYAASGASLRLDDLLSAYDGWFDALGSQLEQALSESLALYPEESVVSAVLNPTYLSGMLDIMKVTLPAFCCIFSEVLGYLTVSLFMLAVKLFRCPLFVPQNFCITLSPVTAVVFIVCYLVTLFSGSGTITLAQAVSENLVLILIPGLFVVGIHSLVRRAKIAERRKSFILTLLVLIFAFLFSPAICIFFIVIDGIGEIFFGRLFNNRR